jgi:hypothetical protein
LERRQKQGIRITESDLPVNPAYIKAVTNLGFAFVAKANWSNYIIVGASNDNQLDKLKKLPMVKEVREIFSQKDAKVDLFSRFMEEMSPKAEKSGMSGDNLSVLPGWE